MAKRRRGIIMAIAYKLYEFRIFEIDVEYLERPNEDVYTATVPAEFNISAYMPENYEILSIEEQHRRLQDFVMARLYDDITFDTPDAPIFTIDKVEFCFEEVDKETGMLKRITPTMEEAKTALRRLETVMPSDPNKVRFGEYSKYTDSYEPFIEDIITLKLALKQWQIAYENWQMTETDLSTLKAKVKITPTLTVEDLSPEELGELLDELNAKRE
jgi:hypothetical protein